MRDLQEQAGNIFSRLKLEFEKGSNNAAAEASERRRKHYQSKELGSNSNLSPLARFLLSRFVVVIYNFFLYYYK